MRLEKTRKGIVLGLATALLVGGVAFGAPAPAAAPEAKATVVSAQTLDRSVERVSRSSTRTITPQVVVKKKSPTAHCKIVSKTQSGRKMTKKSGKTRVVGCKMAQKVWKKKAKTQWKCLEDLWSHESQWSTKSGATHRAYGIPQALPGTKMKSKGSDWRWNERTQIRWGFGYIKGRYHTPCGAWNHFQSSNWY